MITYKGFHYYMSIEEEEDNRKYYHYAVRNLNNQRDMVLLGGDSYERMTWDQFMEEVDLHLASSPFHM